MKILVIHGPNLNMLGKLKTEIYGNKTLAEVNDAIQKRAKELGIEVVIFQSNSEAALIDFIQAHYLEAGSIIINPGALTHYGLSLRDALGNSAIPVIEVHIFNIYAREEWRAKSVIVPIARGQICGLGWRGYIAALELLASEQQ